MKKILRLMLAAFILLIGFLFVTLVVPTSEFGMILGALLGIVFALSALFAYEITE